MEKEITEMARQKAELARMKAVEIYNKMEVDVSNNNDHPEYSHRQARECSFVLIDEMIKELKSIGHERAAFWEAVKAELKG